MAGLWEPVNGVYWSEVPPAAPDEVWSYLPVIAVLLVATITSWVIKRRIKAQRERAIRRRQEWHLRQHITEVGAGLSLVYMAGMLALTWGRIGTLGSMPLNEVGDFLAGAFGPVAFLWLVLGFLQQGDELRQGTEALKLQATELKNSVEQQTIMAGVATEQREERRAALETERARREREIKVKFSIKTGSSGLTGQGGRVMNEIMITNGGHHAYNVVLDMDVPVAGPEAVEIGDIKAHSVKSVKLLIPPTTKPVVGEAVLKYEDADGNLKAHKLDYVFSQNRIEFYAS